MEQIGGTHYKDAAVQPWDVIDTWPMEQRIGAYRAGALKYLMRMGSKDESAQEVAKGTHYMRKLLEVLQPPAPVADCADAPGAHLYRDKFDVLRRAADVPEAMTPFPPLPRIEGYDASDFVVGGTD